MKIKLEIAFKLAINLLQHENVEMRVLREAKGYRTPVFDHCHELIIEATLEFSKL